MFVVERLVDGQWYYWGKYNTQERAEEVRIELQTEYGLIARVREEA